MSQASTSDISSTSSSEKPKTVVLECGSYETKADIAGNSVPRIRRRTVVEIDETLQYPIKFGKVQDWSSAEDFWNQILENDLQANLSCTNLMYVIPPGTSPKEKCKLLDVFLNKFQMQGVYLANSAVLSLLSTARLNGINVDCGHSCTRISTVQNGVIVPAYCDSVELGGKHASSFLQARFFSLPKGHIEAIKHETCYVPQDYKAEIRLAESTYEISRQFKLPDGSTLNLEKERFQCGESLFSPSIMGDPWSLGILDATIDLVRKITQSRRVLDVNESRKYDMILTGGSSLFPGFPYRFQRELDGICEVFAPFERQTSAWVGASVLAALSTTQSQFITKAEVSRQGLSRIVSRSVML